MSLVSIIDCWDEVIGMLALSFKDRLFLPENQYHLHVVTFVCVSHPAGWSHSHYWVSVTFVKRSYDLHAFHESITQLYSDVLVALNDFPGSSLAVTKHQSGDWGFMRRMEPQVNRNAWVMLLHGTVWPSGLIVCCCQWSMIAFVCVCPLSGYCGQPVSYRTTTQHPSGTTAGGANKIPCRKLCTANRIPMIISSPQFIRDYHQFAENGCDKMPTMLPILTFCWIQLCSTNLFFHNQALFWRHFLIISLISMSLTCSWFHFCSPLSSFWPTSRTMQNALALVLHYVAW